LALPAFAQVLGPPVAPPNSRFTNDDAANSIFEQMQRDGGQWPAGAADTAGMSALERRRLTAQQAYFQARLDMQQCEQQIKQLDGELPSAQGDQRTKIQRQLLAQHMQRRSVDLQMTAAHGQWIQLNQQIPGAAPARDQGPPQTRTDEVRLLMDIRQRLYNGDPTGISDALEYMRWKYGGMPEGFSAYDWLAGSEEFGSAIRGFVIMEAERIRVRLREGDEDAVADAWKLWQFINLSDFWFRQYPDMYIALANSDLFGNAMREFVRKRIEQINDKLEDGDKDAVEEAMRLWRFMHAEVFQFRAYPDWHELFGSMPQFSDAYNRFIELMEEDLRRRLREGDPDAIRDAASHLLYKQGTTFERGVGQSDVQRVAGSTEFGDAYRDGFGGQ